MPLQSQIGTGILYLCRSEIKVMNLASILLGMIGPWQIVLIVALVLLLFGGRKIPELMRGLGSGIKEFKGAVKEDDDEDKNATTDGRKKSDSKS